ncbi:MAG: FAD-linked oxidase C-terminal domain-containing protein [Methylococcales bacterium]|nr:FAD-linked oxidase C-terminal domain-containing protein [Methylococcales bacterium]
MTPLINALSKILPKDSLLYEAEQLAVFESDALAAYRQIPLAVVLPENKAQIQAILTVCRNYQVPVVTRGAGTGISGGALPIKQGIVLGLSKLKKILKIDPLQRIACVQSGVRNIQISEAVADYGLYYAPDPSSQIACTIGGNVAENSGGVHCLKYGLTVHNVLSIKMLTIEGDELVLSQEDDGLDLLALMHGSEGLLGIIIEVTVKLLPKPEKAQVVMAGFSTITDAANAVTAIIQQGIIPAGLEMMDAFAIEAVEAFVQVGYPLNAKALLLCEIDGSEERVREEIDLIIALLKQAQAMSIEVSANEHHRLQLWKGRKAAFPAVGRLAPDYYCMDGTIPRHRLAEVLMEIHQLSEHYQLRVANVFHAGDGNLHPLILYDASIAGEFKKSEALGADILQLCLDVGGTITGEHGVGIEKLDSMCSQFATAELATFHAIKHVFDNHALLNPGKAVPTLHRCAELGKMHVHHNQQSFPDLERF